MKLSVWTLAVVACLSDRQFWHEAARETLYQVTSSSSGLGASITSAVLGIGHRAMRAAWTMGAQQSTVELHKL